MMLGIWRTTRMVLVKTEVNVEMKKLKPRTMHWVNWLLTLEPSWKFKRNLGVEALMLMINFPCQDLESSRLKREWEVEEKHMLVQKTRFKLSTDVCPILSRYEMSNIFRFLDI